MEIDLNVTLPKLKNMLFIESPIVALKEISAKIIRRSKGGKNVCALIFSFEIDSMISSCRLATMSE